MARTPARPDEEAVLPSPHLIVAEIGEHSGRSEVRRAAISLAEESHAGLVFYDDDADSLLADPMPTAWSADGAGDEFGDLLSPDDLDVLGRPEMRDLVADARRRGLDAHGWLAGGRGIAPITEYARRIGADLILVAEESLVPDVLDLGEDEILEAARRLPSLVRVGVVRRDGSIDYHLD